LKSQKIKCFAIDIDGTIADDNGRIDFEAAESLRILCDLGYKVIFVSGRTGWEVYTLAAYLGTTRMGVGENGGVIVKSPIDFILLGNNSNALMAYDILSKKIENVELKPTMPRMTEVVLKRTFDLSLGKKIVSESGLPVKIVDSTFAYHVDNKDVNKSVGLKVALKHLQIDPSEVIAVGDSDTDVSMFEYVGTSISVGNATEAAVKSSTYHVKNLVGKGLVEAIHLSYRKVIGSDFEKAYSK